MVREEETESKANNCSSSAVNYRGARAIPFIIGNETFEKIGTLGTLANLMVYLTSTFNMKNITAATVINVFNGTSNMAPLLGAFLSDTYLGRYTTLAFASISSLLGMTVLTLTAAISKLHPPKCSASSAAAAATCIGPTSLQIAFLFAGFGFLVIGAGGIRPCNLAFGADQYDPSTKSGQKGINNFFNWYYFTYTFAVMVSVTVIVYVQSSVSWAIGLAIPASLMFMSCVLFFIGSRFFVKVKPRGSPFTSMAQVLVAALRKRHLELPDHPSPATLCLFDPEPAPNSINSRLPHTNQFRFLDRAAILTNDDELSPNGGLAANPWRLCSVQQVEELKCVVRVIPIWPSAILYHVAMIQQTTYVIFQVLQSDRSIFPGSGFKIPAATYIVFTMLSLTLWIPLYDRILVPSFRKITRTETGITLLQRMGFGILLSVATMVVSGLVEEKRRTLAFSRPMIGVSPKGGAVSSMSALWLVPQLLLTGFSEGFNTLGQLEFYYREFPENMKSIAGSFFYFGAAVSSYLSGFLISVVHGVTNRGGRGDWLAEDLNQGKLDYFYYMIAVLGFLNFGCFLVCAKWYRYKGVIASGAAETWLELGKAGTIGTGTGTGAKTRQIQNGKETV